MRSKGSAWTVPEWEDRGGLDKCLHTMPTIAVEARCRIHDNDWFPVLSLGLHGPSRHKVNAARICTFEASPRPHLALCFPIGSLDPTPRPRGSNPSSVGLDLLP